MNDGDDDFTKTLETLGTLLDDKERSDRDALERIADLERRLAKLEAYF